MNCCHTMKKPEASFKEILCKWKASEGLKKLSSILIMGSIKILIYRWFLLKVEPLRMEVGNIFTSRIVITSFTIQVILLLLYSELIKIEKTSLVRYLNRELICFPLWHEKTFLHTKKCLRNDRELSEMILISGSIQTKSHLTCFVACCCVQPPKKYRISAFLGALKIFHYITLQNLIKRDEKILGKVLKVWTDFKTKFITTSIASKWVFLKQNIFLFLSC